MPPANVPARTRQVNNSGMTLPTPATPAGLAPNVPQIRLYQDWLREQRGLSFADYHALWRWSTTELDAFWQSIWDYFELRSPTPHTAVLGRNVMPGAQWFPGAQANYAHQVFRHVDAAHAAGLPAIVSDDEKGQARELSWPELRRQVASLALHLKTQGVRPGDRVAAYLPNVPETIVAFLAVVSIGAVWSVCAPDMGTNAVLDRFSQIEPAVLIAADGVSWAGRDIDRSAVVQELRAKLPSVRHLVVLHHPAAFESIADSADWVRATALNDEKTAAFEPLWLPFDHPLWIVYSSGTTGLPKPIVHSHGGIVLVAMASGLHMDVGCSYRPNNFGERFHWYSSTGWIMWNSQTSGLLSGTTCVIFNGSPGGPRDAPDWTTLWRFAARHGVTYLGSGAAFYAGCAKAGVDLAQCGDLSRIRALGTTGSPLSPEVQQWGTDQFKRIAEIKSGNPPPGRPMMIDYCILNSHYVLPHVAVTAKARMNAGVGLMGVATHMARKGLRYDTDEGREELHRIAERHMYHAIRASLRISKERGVAPWMHKTRWPDGWLPIDTYNRNVDELGDFHNRYDWEALRTEIMQNGGIAHSCLVAYMPGESSSKALGKPNSLYPVRDVTLNKTDGSVTIRWAAPDSDNPAYFYQSAWDISEVDMIKAYAVFQKFTDQGISADLWRRIKDDDKVSSRELLTHYFAMVKYGMKTRYYYNSNVASDKTLDNAGSIHDGVEEKVVCESCTM